MTYDKSDPTMENDGSLRWQFSTGGVISGSSAAIGWDTIGSHDKPVDGRSGPANMDVWTKLKTSQQGTYLA